MRAVLIGAAPGDGLECLKRVLREEDYCICADGGRKKAEAAGIRADWYVGDSDSGGSPEGLPSTILPSEKDVSDMEMAVDQAFAVGCRKMILTGCSGGRADHYLANLSLLEQIHARGGEAMLLDNCNEIRLLVPGTYEIENEPAYRYLGLIPLDATIEGVCLAGVKYPLDRFTLHRGSTRSVSNEILPGERAIITIGSGRVLLVRSQPQN